MYKLWGRTTFISPHRRLARAHTISHAHTCKTNNAEIHASLGEKRFTIRSVHNDGSSTFRRRHFLASPASVRFWRIPAAQESDHARRFRALCAGQRVISARAGTDVSVSLSSTCFYRGVQLRIRARLHVCAETRKERSTKNRGSESGKRRERER